MSLKSDLVESRGKLEDRKKQLADVFAEAGKDYDMSKVKSLEGDETAKVEGIRKLNDEINDLQDKVTGFVDAIKALDDSTLNDDDSGKGKGTGGVKHQNDLDDDQPVQQKSIGEMFVKSPAYTEFTSGATTPLTALEVKTLDGMKTLMTTSAGWAPQSLRTGLMVPSAQKPIQVIDTIPLGRTGYVSIIYMEETTFTNNAAETSEGSTYAESALALTQRTSPVQKIATFLPVTDEQLEDVEGIPSYIDNRLTYMLRARLDSQIINGDGIAPNLKGILNVSGIQTQAKGADPTPDAVYKAMTLIRTGTGQANPDTVYFNPSDWQNVKLLRTAEGMYIWGNPADVLPDRIWGMNVAFAQVLTAGTAIVLDSSFTNLLMKRDIEIQVSNSHSTFFVEGKQAIRADVRCAFVVYRPAAVCKVTGI